MPSSFGFDRYQIQAELGRGGMGIVYQAIDKDSNETVAIKQLVLKDIDPKKHPEFIERFQREAKTASRLIHENIVKVIDISKDAENLYYVMEHLEGKSLKEELKARGGTITAHDFFRILQQVVSGISYAHSLNIVHRDIKPDNIFIVDEGRVVITDFGIARIADLESTNITKTGVMLGTLAYVSPEQLQDAKKVDHRADIFSLGVVAYEALSGYLPFTDDGIAATIVKIMSHEETPLHILNPSIKDELSSTISRALRKHPKDRFRSVQEFLRQYQKALEFQPNTGTDLSNIDPLSTTVDTPVSKVMLTTADSPIKDLVDTEPNIEELVEHENEESAEIQKTEQSEAFANYAKELASLKESGSDSPPETKKRRRIGGTSNVESKKEKSKKVKAPLGIRYNPIKPAFLFNTAANEEEFKEPAVVGYRSGRVVVADIVRRTAYIYGQDGRFITQLKHDTENKESSTSGGLLTKPSGIEIDEKGKIYICDSSDHFIRVFDSQGCFQKEFKNLKGSSGGLQGIAIDSKGLLYVSDADNHSLQVFQADVGVWVREVTTHGDGEFKLPSGITTDRLNKVYVVDYGTCKISIFNKAGQHLRTFGAKGKGDGMFNVPRAIAVDKHDRIFVLDSLNHRIQAFSSSGDWIYSYGELGSEPGEFIGPSDLKIDNENNLLYVADKGNKRVQVLELAFK